MTDLFFEKQLGRETGTIICGADEVGRGPLAGPVVAAAVIIPAKGLGADLESQIKDSKKLTDAKRHLLFPLILQECPHAIAEASVEEIDQINILQASLLAMRRAIEALGQVDHALIDGNKLPKLSIPATAIVKGDDKSLSIAAASIIAKVSRDETMRSLAKEWPGYGWERNAGYPTAEHIAALEKQGLTPWHRRSFGPVKRLLAS